MSTTPLYASQLWPPARPRTADPTAPTPELLEALGYVGRTDATGVHTLLPLGQRVHDRLTRIAQHAFETVCGAHTVHFPTLQSRRLWESSGRWTTYQTEGALLTTRSRSGEEMCLAPTSEEIAVATLHNGLRSYRDLPVRLFLSTPKFRDELSPRGGLMRSREFTMADAYTFDTSPQAMGVSIGLLNNACRTALVTMGLTGVFTAPADGGSITAGPSTEHLHLTPTGQSTLLVCDHCGHRGDGPVLTAHPQPVPDPVVNTIAFTLTRPDGTTTPAAVAIRSDLTVSPRKLATATGAARVTLCDPDTLPDLFGKQPGTLTPFDCTHIPLYADTSTAHLTAFSVWDPDTELRTVSWHNNPHLPDLTPVPADLHTATATMRCARCATGRFRETRAVEVAHVFELATQYTAPMNLTYTTPTGRPAHPYMACSGIGITRCLQTLAELHRDEHGLRWKPGTGPADLHLTVLRPDRPGVREAADRAVHDLTARGARVLVDDRPDAGPGEKFRYARALGVPHALLVSPQHTDGATEYTDRWTGRTTTLPLGHIPDTWSTHRP
ncbi:proline--tRNA ligase [Streptomyces sp. NPDC057638]|uniref:proline--tRNA ligase n=1 Tax=Streptomyces sp. NPDC057638 TaxID=3346190 RepID=UPI0036B1246C